MIYSRGITEQPGFMSTDDGGAESRTERRWQLTQAAIEPEIQRIIGGNSELRLRGVQAPALEAIQRGQSPVVAVIPTGGGKSLLFMLPAWISPRGVTVVVVPLIALRGDMVHRCRQLGISCVAWESRRPADQASIVLVTLESAITEDFMTFLNRQRLCHRLDRIVIDKYHVVLNDQTNFRPAIAQLGRLLVAQAQMIYLTATLPPTAENQLFQRLRTSREKVEEPNIVRFIGDRIRRARANGRVVIYGPTTNTIEKLAQLVECEAYHSRTIDRYGVLARFQADTTGVVAATSALGIGVDIPNIRSIIHIGLPRSLLDYAQESGRASRDGLRRPISNSLPIDNSTPRELTHSLPTRVARPLIPTHTIDQFQRLDRERQVVQEWCTQRGLEDRHDLYECRAQTQYGNNSPKGWWLRVRRQVKYAAFGGYYGY
ncbi:hypothetical protein PENARI_c169G02057, partial [Penicillium arizonense]